MPVVKGDRLVWAKGFGVADLATGSPATPRTSYLWFSMTKIVTATAVMSLAEGGKLDLDAPADEYFRGLKGVSQPTPVTVRHLLSHSSGLANPWLSERPSLLKNSPSLLLVLDSGPKTPASGLHAPIRSP